MRRLDNIDLRLLRIYAALVESGGFADAQIVLNLSASTLSSHLAALERNIGGKLCDRGRRGFQLTPLGEATYFAAKKLFDDIADFQQRVASENNKLIGQLRIGAVDGIVSNDELGLDAAIARYMQQAEKVYIDIELSTPHELETAVAEGRRDIAIGPFSKRASGVEYRPLLKERHALYCGAGHALFGLAERDLTREAIDKALLSVRGYRQLDDLYRVDHPRPGASVMNMEAQEILILSGHFIGYLPCHLGNKWVAQKKMRLIKFHNYSFDSVHYLAIQKQRMSNIIIETFVKELFRKKSAT